MVMIMICQLNYLAIQYHTVLMQDDKWIVMRMVIFDVLDFCSIDRCDTMRVVFCLLTSTEVGIGQQDGERGGSCDNAPGICSLCLWCRCDHFASRLLYSWLSRAYHGVEKAKLRNHLQFSRSDESQTGKVSVWVSLRFSVVCLTRPGVSAVARGIFIISNLLRQKTDTNTILASHGVMSSLVKLFSVKFHSLTNMTSGVGCKYCGSEEFMEWV